MSLSREQIATVTRFKGKVAEQRVPVDGSIELSHRCNLKCIHCYLGDQDEIRQHRKQEMSTAQVKSVIDQLVAAGTLNLTITGGDPMVRKDFAQIYEYAVRSGLLVTVFCDAVLITDRIVELFDKLPPRSVEVSIYGATAATYEAITQVPGSFGKCLAGIEQLRNHGHRFMLKTVLMTPNAHELEQMRAMAEAYGVKFNFDSAIFPCLAHADNAGKANRLKTGGSTNTGTKPRTSVEVAPPSLSGLGRKQPVALRVEPALGAKAQAFSEQRIDELAQSYVAALGAPRSDAVYQCGAALTTFHIDPYGDLQACTISTGTRYNVLDGSFMEGWNGPLKALRDLRQSRDKPCVSCDKRTLCVGCPAVFEAETGAKDLRSSYMCQTTHALFDRIEPRVRELLREIPDEKRKQPTQ
ncbi:MAG: radical SAM protein [Gammaproteobacteria bacterium]|nr:radical SAM protein [Gammaproteobacteria bacterium]